MHNPWSRLEVEAAVSDYFGMLSRELKGEAVNKAEHNRALQSQIKQRSKGSIERKHQNISAVLIELGYPYIRGYKPLRNYQQLLADVIIERLEAVRRTGFDDMIESIVSDPGNRQNPPFEVHTLEVDAPKREPMEPAVREPGHWMPTSARRNYLELEARNSQLGRAGEELVLQFERERLWQAGKGQLAERIDHVASTVGDHLGFDIHSFEEDGRDRLIEVKTTRFGMATPFFVTANEVNVSRDRAPEYQLYRVFDFARSPHLFRLQGCLERTCTLSATEFKALPW